MNYCNLWLRIINGRYYYMNEKQIPKKIHFCWFGGNPKPDIIKKCIDSWKTYMPDYEIIEWNESNYDVTKAAFIKEAYEAKKCAFVSDYARFDIIHNNGGIYFDTDVELLKPIPEEILNCKNFTGFETAGKVNPGLVYADVKNGNLTKKIINKYNTLHFVFDEKTESMTVNTIITSILEPLGLKLNGEYQVVDGLTVFPASVFCAFDQDVKEIDIKPDTISVHHYAGTWTTKSTKKVVRDVIKKILGVNGYRVVLSLYRKIRAFFK